MASSATPHSAHIAQLAAQLNAQVVKSLREAEPRAQRVGQTYHIIVGPCGTPGGYFTALHEIGHIACRHLERKVEKGGPQQLADECEAWQWALDHSKLQPTISVKKQISAWISTYLQTATFTPNPDHPVWALKNVVEPDRTVAGPKGVLP